MMRWLGQMGVILMLAVACWRCTPAPEAAALRGADFLASIQRPDGAIADTVNPLFDTWETVEAATALWAVRQDTTDPALRRALGFLRHHENAAGMLCHNVKCQAAYCLETTAEYLILLAEIHGAEAIRPRLDTLRKLQGATGAWHIGNPDVREQPLFPSVTAFVLAAFAAAEAQPAQAQPAMDWLLAQQQPQGHWGTSWEYYGCEAYALWPMARVLAHAEAAPAQAAWARASARIHDTQAPDGSWATAAAGPRRVSAALETALMACALSQTSDESSAQALDRAQAYLQAQQRPDGSWDGGHFPIQNARYQKQEYVFATARAIIALIGTNPEPQ